MELTVQPSINDARSQALLVLDERLGQIDLSPLLVYRIASVPDSALPFLAWQFDVLSPLWQLMGPAAGSIDALTVVDMLTDIDSLGGSASGSTAAQRTLLEQSISLHRIRGTPAAIKRALAQFGWTGVSLLEGEASWGGTSYPAAQRWAVFRVLVSLAAGDNVESGAIGMISAAIDFFKPARAWLDAIVFILPPVSDSAPAPADYLLAGGVAELQIDRAPAPADPTTITAVLAPVEDPYGPIMPLHNGHYRHSGITYGTNEPVVADTALILNGGAILQGG
jgi:P2-related tail formation protein